MLPAVWQAQGGALDDKLRQSAWGWTQWVLPCLQGQNPPTSELRYGWRHHLLRCQFIQGRYSSSLWLEAQQEEPELFHLFANVAPAPDPKPARLLGHASPGLQADQYCDWAWHAWRDGATTKAAHCVHQALILMPGHAEAMVWLELFKGPRHPGSQRSSYSIDQSRLTPKMENGWISPERWRRRGLTHRWLTPAPPHTALYHLQERGIQTRTMGSSQWYRHQPADHAAIAIEALADQIVSQIISLRDPRPIAWTAWQQATSMGTFWIQRLARFLIKLALQNPFLVHIGLLASAILRQLEPDTVYWSVAEARLLAEQGQQHQATILSRRLNHRSLTPEAADLLRDTLFRCGHHREAIRLRGPLQPMT